MGLIVKVISYKGAPPSEPLIAHFNEAGGSIGRKSDNHLVLPDKDQIISRRHGHIEYGGGRFSYHDTSLHGTELCGQGRVLSNDSVPLAHGDRLRIGDYELSVEITPAAHDMTQPIFGGFQGHQAPPRPNILDTFEPNSSALLFGDTTAPPEPKPSSFFDQPDVPLFQESFVLPPVAIPETSAMAPAPAQLPDDVSIDAFFGGEPDKVAAPKQNTVESPDDLLSDALFGADFGTVFQETPPAQPMPGENTGLVSMAGFQPPGVSAPIPTAFTPVANDQPPMPFPFELEKQAPPATDPAGSLRTAATAEASPPEIETNWESPLTANPREDLPATSALNPAGLDNDAFRGTPEGFGRSERLPTHQELPPQPQTIKPSEATASANLLRCFLEGAEIRDLPALSPEEQAAAMRLLGAAYREMVDGMMVLLRARMEERREFRASDFTIIEKSGNNPLKFFPDAESTMKAMLLQASHPGYLDAASAVRDGLMDIKSHQLAMRAGIQASLRVILKSFDPNRFEEIFKDSFSFQKKAKCWDAYNKDYPKLVNEATENLFKDSFAEVYEKQVRILQESHDKN